MKIIAKTIDDVPKLNENMPKEEQVYSICKACSIFSQQDLTSALRKHDCIKEFYTSRNIHQLEQTLTQISNDEDDDEFVKISSEFTRICGSFNNKANEAIKYSKQHNCCINLSTIVQVIVMLGSSVLGAIKALDVLNKDSTSVVSIFQLGCVACMPIAGVMFTCINNHHKKKLIALMEDKTLQHFISFTQTQDEEEEDPSKIDKQQNTCDRV